LLLLYHQITSIFFFLPSTNYTFSGILVQLYSVTNTPLLFTLYSPTQTSTPHFITSHQSQHHLNAHPTASDRSTLDNHHHSIILKHDHLQTSRCPALFSLIDPYLTSLTIALASFQTSPPLSLIPFRFIPSILKPAIHSKINWT
jgi:hypothetical protein